jgi:HD superfamily phosphodiesterase
MHSTSYFEEINNAVILKKLNKLIKETFLLWDEVWVGFSWRNYYFNHTQRVRALSLKIGRNEDADLKKLEYAAILHDVTKRYDGRIVTDSEGKRILDEEGFWHNELLMPKRENLVTTLYREYDQLHKLHNVTAAFIAEKILRSYGFPADFYSSVSSIIKGHLKPDTYSEEYSSNILERRILYEADTIDANLGLTAFFRHVNICSHRSLHEEGKVDLQEYVNRIEPWIKTKVFFIDRMMTETGTRIAKERNERMKEQYSNIENELQNNFIDSLNYGILGIIGHFIDHNQDPCLKDEINYLSSIWIPERENMLKTETDPNIKIIFHRAVNFCNLLSQEIEGY